MFKKFLIMCSMTALLFSMIVIPVQSETNNQVMKIEEMMMSAMERFDVPGMSLVIVEDGEISFSKGLGVMEKGDSSAVDSDTIFAVGSVAKNFLAVAIMQLQEKELLNINDPVIKYIPWFRTANGEQSDKITISHLLSHSSGIPENAYGLEMENASQSELETQIRRLSEVKPVNSPGESYQYSNANYWILQYMVERISGMDLSAYMKQNVFEPVQMNRSGYLDDIKTLENRATGHRYV